MPKYPIVLVHGYSDQGESYRRWCELLQGAGYDATTIHLGNYVSLSNEISIKDIAEGFDRALRESPLKNGEPFDAIVHSTGMLVVREWLAGTTGTLNKPELALQRQARLKRLIGLAPATFGSPMAHKGRSWLGALFKGGREPGPDFMEAGDQVLKGLELGSRYTWSLAHRDFLHEVPVYGKSAGSPYPFIFIGLKDYGWLKSLVTDAGTDGTVRWSGAGFNSRKVMVDLCVEAANRKRISVQPWKNSSVPLVFLPDHNHSDILRNPSPELVRMVFEALQVSKSGEYEDWARKQAPYSNKALARRKAKRWQQFVVHAVDERGDGIADYFVEMGTVDGGSFKRLNEFDMDVHAWREDESYRCFHVDLDKLKPERHDCLALRIIASSGSELVGYHGYNSSLPASAGAGGKWDAVIEFDAELIKGKLQFFYPYTTTLIEIMMNREPMPLSGVNKVFWFRGRG